MSLLHALKIAAAVTREIRHVIWRQLTLREALHEPSEATDRRLAPPIDDPGV